MSDTQAPPPLEAVLTAEELDSSTVHAAFADERRRATLAALSDGSVPEPVSQLARDVAAIESAGDPGDVPDDVVDRVHVTLHHVHLPKLEALDLVEYEPDADRVTAVADPVAGSA